jgi:hypothetical protein
MKHLRRFNESVELDYAPIFTELLEEDLGAVAIFDLVEDWENGGAEFWYFTNDEMDGVKVSDVNDKISMTKDLLTASILDALKDGTIMDNPSKVICIVYNPEPVVQELIDKIKRKCGKVSTTVRTGTWGIYSEETILIF